MSALHKLFPFALISSLALGCSLTPEQFARSEARATCRMAKRCNRQQFVEEGYSSVRECAQDALDENSPEDFADACDDFDRQAARKCLRGIRQARRACDPEKPDDQLLEACAEVCGDSVAYRAADLERLLSGPTERQQVEFAVGRIIAR